MSSHLAVSLLFNKIERHISSLSNAEKLVIICNIWPHPPYPHVLIEDFDQAAYDSYFQYLGDELGPLCEQKFRFAAATFDNIPHLIRILSNHRSETLSSLLQLTRKSFLNVDVAALQRSIELTVRLWLTVNVNSAMLAVGPINAYERPLDWPLSVSLECLIRSQFEMSSLGSGSHVKSRIDPAFTAADLVYVCGMGIRWTNNLSDHLIFDRKGRTVSVYKHKVCLLHHLKAKDGCPIPREILEETLDTLNLLFPFGDSSTKQLLSREGLSSFYSLGSCNRDRQLDLTRYKYWREELSDLIEAFNEPPKSWRQLLIDSRNMKDWATFWIGVMVLFLTLVTIPSSIVQTIYTVKGYNLALQQAKSAVNAEK